jgi:hypothetical protein
MSLLTLDRDRVRTNDNSADIDCWIPVAYFVPDFTARIEQELDRLAALPANWDGQGAVAIDGAVLQAARDLIGELPAFLTTVPAVVPLANGRLQFEWHEGSRSLELEFEDADNLHFLKWHPSEGIEDEGVYSADDLDRTIALIRWFQRGVVNV